MFLLALIEREAATVAAFARRIGIERKKIHDALSEQHPLISYQTAAELGAALRVPYVDFFADNRGLEDRLRAAGLAVPREHVDQPQGTAWAERGIEAQVADLLRVGRPVVIWGRPGIGKASLAAYLVATLRGELGHGAIWIDGRVSTDPARIHERIASALRFHYLPADPLAPASDDEFAGDHFAAYFWSRPRVLVIQQPSSARFVRAVSDLRGLRRGPMRDSTPMLVLTSDHGIASELSIEDAFESVELPPIPRVEAMAFLRRCSASCAAADDEDADLERLVQMCEGRPSLLRRALAFAGRADLSLAGSVREMSLGALGQDERDLARALCAVGDVELPKDWARSLVPEMSQTAFAAALVGLAERRLIEFSESDGLRAHCALLAALGDELHGDDEGRESAARAHLARKTAEEAHRLSANRDEAWNHLQRWRPLWETALDLVVAAAEHPEPARAASVSAHDRALDALLALSELLPVWGNPRAERWLRVGLRLAAGPDRAVDHARLGLALARLLVRARADFAAAAELLEQCARVGDSWSGADAARERSAQRVAGRCLAELVRCTFVLGRPARGAALLGRAVRFTRAATLDPYPIALMLNVSGATASRREPPVGTSASPAGWLEARRLFAEAFELVRADERTRCRGLASVLELNLAVARWKAGDDHDADHLASCIGSLLSRNLDALFDAMLLATAVDAGVIVRGGSVEGQRHELEGVWHRWLDARHVPPAILAFCVGELLFYASRGATTGAGGYRAVVDDTAIADFALARRGTTPPTASWYGLFCVAPLAQMIDAEFLDRAEHYLIRNAPPDTRALRSVNDCRAMLGESHYAPSLASAPA